jgi:hypothetical protein
LATQPNQKNKKSMKKVNDSSLKKSDRNDWGTGLVRRRAIMHGLMANELCVNSVRKGLVSGFSTSRDVVVAKKRRCNATQAATPAQLNRAEQTG